MTRFTPLAAIIVFTLLGVWAGLEIREPGLLAIVASFTVGWAARPK